VPPLDGNLIIHGDNLHALKALLPYYAGKIDCIFIDPPYNTGNENWAYNDNVDSPMMREWLSSNPVNIEDMLRHDKWLCMMYPRLKLLHELLSDRGSLWMTLDDNEVHHARMALDEIFTSPKPHVGSVIWQKKYATKSDTEFFSESHDNILVYAKNRELMLFDGLQRTAKQDANYKNLDGDPRGLWASDNLLRTEERDYAIFEIISPTGIPHLPPKGSSWRFGPDKITELLADNRLWFGEDGNNKPRLKRFLEDVQKRVPPQTIWSFSEVGHSDSVKKSLADIFGSTDAPFATPKPVELIERILSIATDEDSIVLDSFAGSGTTGHALLNLNRRDSGSRKFILVECEGYADQLTAGRMRRIIGGYTFRGSKREELLRERVTFSSLKKAGEILNRIAGIQNLEGHRFDKVEKKIEDGNLTVVGLKNIEERVEGLGGAFTYCTLGQPLNLDALLSGKNLPDFVSLGSWLFHTATGETLPPERIDSANSYLGESREFYVWLLYRPDLAFLKSADAALTLDFARKAVAAKTGKRHLVFAAQRYVTSKVLLPLGVEHAPLPDALFRLTSA